MHLGCDPIVEIPPIMKYAYEDLSPEQLEKLVVLICKRLFGISNRWMTARKRICLVLFAGIRTWGFSMSSL
jgi:hypothetical protein